MSATGNTARRHHIVPASYLAGFTQDESIDGRLFVVDTSSGKRWPSTPRSSGHRRDFYAVDHPDLPADAIERDVLGRLEGQVAPVLRHVVAERALPSGDDLEVLYHFLAMQAVRVEGVRSTMNQAMRDISQLMMREMLATPERWEATQRQLREARPDAPNVSYEDMRKFVDRGEYDVSLNQDYHIGLMLKMYNGALPTFRQRGWSVLVAQDEPFFITSDRPVGVHWSDPPRGAEFMSPGFGVGGTMVVAPIHRTVALIGSFETPSGQSMVASTEQIASLNSATGAYADRHLFSATEGLVWRKSDGSVGTVEDLVTAIAEDRTRKEAQAEEMTSSRDSK